MINNVYELVLGVYLAIVLFFLGYMSLGSQKETFMKNYSLNWIFMVFFIVFFFLLGYLFQNVILSFKEVKVENRKFINTQDLKKQ